MLRISGRAHCRSAPVSRINPRHETGDECRRRANADIAEAMILPKGLKRSQLEASAEVWNNRARYMECLVCEENPTLPNK